MKLYRYWAKQQDTIRVHKDVITITCYGGSNGSMEEAIRRAQEKILVVQKKVQGDWDTIHNYQASAEIREEIIEELDPENIITRNRYGALVLNSEKMLIIDIDDARFGPLDLLRGQVGARWKKPKIMEIIEKQASRHPNLNFLIYETFNGYRVIVTGATFDARSPVTQSVFREFNADRLYATLCKKQECFRARLTPKPHRIQCKRHHVVYPRTAEEDAALKDWLEIYQEKSRNFSVCKFVKAIGSSQGNAIIRYHDELTRAHSLMELA